MFIPRSLQGRIGTNRVGSEQVGSDRNKSESGRIKSGRNRIGTRSAPPPPPLLVFPGMATERVGECDRGWGV